MTDAEADTWIRGLGWQLEVAHTAVLSALLSDPSIATRCAQGLLAEENVSAVSEVARERQAHGGRHRSRADLTFVAEIEGAKTHIAVETKVHSQATWEQLLETTEGGARGVLLAPGRVGMRIPDDFMCALEEQSGARWRLLDVETWKEVADRSLEGASSSPWIAEYVAKLRGEADLQRRALERAEDADIAHAENMRDACAWLRAMRGHLEPVLDRRWAAEGQLSGEILYNNFEGAWRASNEADLYLSFNAAPERIIFAVRAGAGRGGHAALAAFHEDEQLMDALRSLGLDVAGRPHRNWQSATVAGTDVTRCSASEGAALVKRATTALDSASEDALRAAGAAGG